MKKRYLLTPVAVLVLAAGWNIVFNDRIPTVTAEELKRYLAPKGEDTRHPIDVFQVTVIDGETESDVLAKLPTQIYPEDKVRFVIDPKLGLGTIVQVERALPVTIKDGKSLITTRTWENTVADVLGDLDRSLGDLDKANYAPGDLLIQNMQIEITRVAKTKVSIKETIPFETVEKDDPNLDRGQTKVTEEGKNGERTKTFEVIREDGVEVSRTLVKNEVTKEPKKKVVVKGTKIKIGRTVQGRATYYDLCCTKVASTTFKKGTALRITNLNNGKQIEVKVDDTGAFTLPTVVDLHPSYFMALGGTLGQGVLQNIKAEEILSP